MLLPKHQVLAKEGSRHDTLRFDLTPLQRGLHGCPWRTAVASILLCRTHHGQVRQCLPHLFAAWPGPEELAQADLIELASVIRGCGFGSRRAQCLKELSRRWCAEEFDDMRDLPSVGEYVADAVGLFCFDCADLVTVDKVLVAYAAELREANGVKETKKQDI